MTTPIKRTSRPDWVRRLLSARPWLCAPIVALLAASVCDDAIAQPTTRGQPILRTPNRNRKRFRNQQNQDDDNNADSAASATPSATPAPPKPPAPLPGTTTAPAKPLDPSDPMSNVKTAAKEIDFKPQGDAYLVNFNLDDAELPEIVKAISNITGRRFIYGGKLRQIKATVYSPEKVSAGEAYAAFLSILEQNAMTVIPHGRYLKIIETPGVVGEETPIYANASPVPDEDRYITRLYHLAHMDAGEAATVLSKFKTKDADITAYGPSNLLIITETGSNLKRILRIAEEVDVGGAGEQIYVEPINYGSATDMAAKLNEILGLQKPGSSGGASPTPTVTTAGKNAGPSAGSITGGGAGARIIADDRANTIIMVATENDYKRLLDLINRMDVKQSGEGEIHVIPLQYAACKDLSQTLNQILGTTSLGAGAGARPPGATGAAGATPGRPGVPGAPGGMAGNGLQDEVFEGRVRVTCDESTNSLVTTSSLRDYAQLRNVIDKLDIPRRQVFIEAVIMDVSVDRSTDLNIGYHAGAPLNFGTLGEGVFYGGNNPAASVAGVPSNLQALALGVVGPPISGGPTNLFGTGVSIPALGMVLSAIAQDGDNNVLATPHILATDNQEAIINIGQNIPLQTNLGGAPTSTAGGAAASAGLAGLLGGGLGFQAPRQDIGTKIDVTPHVNDSDQVRLDLKEEISDAGSPQGALGAIPINKRTAQTTLVVRDQQTVIIGGLMRDAYITSDTKIPVLGDIPVLGFLFRQSHREKQKSNLLLILTPYVIRDQDDLRAIFERKMQERQEFIDRYFVFNDRNPWSPPRDFSRSNGLVEDIRQSLMAQEEKARLEEETKAQPPKSHAPTAPIALPAAAGRPGAPSVEVGAPGAQGQGQGGNRTNNTRGKPAATPSGGGGAPRHE